VKADTRPSDLILQAADCDRYWPLSRVKLQLFILHCKEIEGSDLKSIVRTTHRVCISSFTLKAWRQHKTEEAEPRWRNEATCLNKPEENKKYWPYLFVR
jgi:hypothetical protein